MEYKPYGKEWKNEMMKLRKNDLIQFIKELLCRENANVPEGGGRQADSTNKLLSEVRAALKDLEDYIRGDTLEIIVSGNDGFDGQEIIVDPESRDIVMQNIKIIFEKLSEYFR